jgi:hypothetical protein
MKAVKKVDYTQLKKCIKVWLEGTSIEEPIHAGYILKHLRMFNDWGRLAEATMRACIKEMIEVDGYPIGSGQQGYWLIKDADEAFHLADLERVTILGHESRRRALNRIGCTLAGIKRLDNQEKKC